jgi:putative oxidoreductase
LKRDWLLLPALSGGADLALLATRLLTGSFLIHGVWDNMVNAERMAEFVDFLAASGFVAPQMMAPLSVWAQLAIGIALILGLLTRWAGLLLAFNFIVGVVMVHWDQSFREWWPAIVLVALGALFATIGGGRYAVDRRLERNA